MKLFKINKLVVCRKKFIQRMDKLAGEHIKCAFYIQHLDRQGYLVKVTPDMGLEIKDKEDLNEKLKGVMEKLRNDNEFSALLLIKYRGCAYHHGLLMMFKKDQFDPEVIMQIKDVQVNEQWPKYVGDIEDIARIDVYRMKPRKELKNDLECWSQERCLRELCQSDEVCSL